MRIDTVSYTHLGGLPDYVDFKEIIEPLRNLFKDEVRKAGLELGIPEYLVFRQPFPGPGLGIRIIGEVTAEKVKMVQDADAIWREEIDKAGIAHEIGQYFAADVYKRQDRTKRPDRNHTGYPARRDSRIHRQHRG